MSIRSLSLELDLDSGKFTASMASASGATSKFSQDIDGASASLKRIENATAGPLARLRDFTLVFSGVRDAIHLLDDAVVSWSKSMIDSAAGIERTTKMLSGMSDAVGDLAKSKDAQLQLTSLITMAKNAPFSLNTLTQAFVRLKAGGLDPMKGTLQGLVDAVAHFGGSDEQLDHAALAIQEMAGRGVVSLEQLRRQLGKAIPDAISMMAAGMGMSYQQLVDAVKKGTVESSSAISKMVAMFELAFGGSAQAQMETFAGKMNVLKTAFTEFSMVVVGLNTDGSTRVGGFFDTIKKSLDQLIAALQSPAMRQFGAQLAESMISATNAVTSLVRGIASLSSTVNIFSIVKDAAMALAVVLAFDLGIGAIAKVKAGFAVMTDAFMGFRAAAGVLGSVMDGTIAILNSGGAATAEFTTLMGIGRQGMILFGAATLNLIPVIGTIAFGIYTLGDAFGLFTSKADSAKKALDEFNHTGVASSAQVDALKKSMDSKRQDLADAAAQAAAPKYMLDSMAHPEDKTDAMKAADKQKLAQAQKDLNQAVADYNRVNAVKMSDDAKDEGDTQAKVTLIKDHFDTIRTNLRGLAQDLTQFEKDHKGDPDVSAVENAKIAILTKMRGVVAGPLADLNKQIAEQQKMLDNALKDSSDKGQAAQAKISATIAGLQTAKDSLSNPMDALDAPNKTVGAPKTDHATSLLDTLKERAAQLTAELQGSAGYAAKISEELKIDPSFLNATQQVKDALMGAAKQLDALEAKKSGKSAFEDLSKEADKQADAAGLAKTQLDALLGSTAAGAKSNNEYAAGLDDMAKKALTLSDVAGTEGKSLAASAVANKKFVDSVNQTTEAFTKLQDAAGGNNSEAKSLFAQLTSGNDKANVSLAAYAKQMQDLVDKTLPEARAQAQKLADSAVAGQGSIDAVKSYETMAAQIKSINTDLELDTKKKAQDALNATIDNMNQSIAWDKLNADQRKTIQTEYYAWLKAEQAKAAQDSEGPLAKMAQQWEQLSQNMEQASAGWVSSFVDGIATGQMNFRNFATSILTDITKIILQAEVAKAIMAALGTGGGGASAGSIMDDGTVLSGSSGGSILGSIGSSIMSMFHGGGIAGQISKSMLVNPDVFDGATKYHTGGVAGLAPDEVPAILQKGEGVFTASQMSAMGTNQQGVPNITVNVVNQSGTPMSAQQGNTRFDASGAIVDVVVDAMSKPGKMRDAVKAIGSN